MSDLTSVMKKYIFFTKNGRLTQYPAHYYVTPGLGANSLYSRFTPTNRKLEDQVTDVKKTGETKPVANVNATIPVVDQTGRGTEDPSATKEALLGVLEKVTPKTFAQAPYEVETKDFSNQSTKSETEPTALLEPPAKKSHLTRKSNNFCSADLRGSSDDDSDDEESASPYNW